MELGTPGLESFRVDGVLPWSAVDHYPDAAGDLNGDGVDDFVMRERAIPQAPDGTPESGGRVYVIFGKAPSGALSFIRGDANADGTLNLTDPVTLLEHLFRGGPELGCRDAADADDDGELTLTDAVYALLHLFLGGPPPPAPYPEPGSDPTEDVLDCAGARR
jgi:hypothetical protein